MWYDEDIIYSQVKRVDISINDEVWLAIAGLRNIGIPIGKSNIVGLEDFNKVQFFKSCLRNPNTKSRSYYVGGLAVIPSILAFIVIRLVTPRGFNRVVLTEEDLLLMYCLLGKIKVNWVSVIKEHIRRKIEYKISYVILISHFIESFEIDFKGEVVETMKAQNEISATTLSKIGLKKVNDEHWMCKADGDGPDQQQDEVGEGAGTSAIVAEAEGGYNAHMSGFPPTGNKIYFTSS